ncbi:sulfotransferase domain-containing protein [Planktotalea sp.]|uniref:sulfotransferase domain-containing protein n=1 Tax=Planktotalea sp. TaxID=2029877 RepID=UPI0035C80084
MRVFRILSTAPNIAKVLQKEFLARGISYVRPVYLVNEYPKSGGTWLKYMLADALELQTWTKETPTMGSCVMQAHWMRQRGNCRPIVQFRDGRDVMVSYYYHSFFRNEFKNASYVKFMRDTFEFADYDDVRANLLPFMKRMLNDPISPSFSWVDFVRVWAGKPGTIASSYEALRRDPAGELSRIVSELQGIDFPMARAQEVADAHTMERMRARKAKDAAPSQDAEVSFIRKGSIGGWTEYFTDDALDWFSDRAGTELTQLGYDLGRPSGTNG